MTWKPWTAGRILSVACLLLVGGVIFAAPVAASGVLGPVAVIALKDGKRLFAANDCHTKPLYTDLIEFVLSLRESCATFAERKATL